MFSNKSSVRESALDKSDIIRYYEQCEEHYRTFWHLEHSLAMHAGFWDSDTRNLKEALKNENKVLAEIAAINHYDHVLDAGCGVGGSSLFLSENYGCKVTGITLSQKQANKARDYAKARNISPEPVFEVEDFTETSYPDDSFDVIWAIESVCHANDKKDFIREAFRRLKPKGRLVVADGFNTKSTYSFRENNLMKDWLKGWGVNELVTKEAFYQGLQETGFHQIKTHDFTTQVLPSSRKLFYLSYPGLWMAKMGSLFKSDSELLISNLISARAQYKALKQELWKYIVFSAVK